MSELSIRFLIGLAASAGAYFGAFKRMRKDVNGIGKRQREFEKNSTLAHMTQCPPELRPDIAVILKGRD
jgi:hypothetical protein